MGKESQHRRRMDNELEPLRSDEVGLAQRIRTRRCPSSQTWDSTPRNLDHTHTSNTASIGRSNSSHRTIVIESESHTHTHVSSYGCSDVLEPRPAGRPCARHPSRARKRATARDVRRLPATHGAPSYCWLHRAPPHTDRISPLCTHTLTSALPRPTDVAHAHTRCPTRDSCCSLSLSLRPDASIGPEIVMSMSSSVDSTHPVRPDHGQSKSGGAHMPLF